MSHLRCWAALASHFFRLIECQMSRTTPSSPISTQHFLGVSKNRDGPQIIPFQIGFSFIINHPFWGAHPYFWKHPPVFSKSPISGTVFISMLSRSCLFKPNHHLWGDLQHTTPLSLFCPDVVFPREKSWSKSTIKTTAVTTAQKRKDFPCQAMTLNPKSVIHSSDASIWIFKWYIHNLWNKKHKYYLNPTKKIMETPYHPIVYSYPSKPRWKTHEFPPKTRLKPPKNMNHESNWVPQHPAVLSRNHLGTKQNTQNLPFHNP